MAFPLKASRDAFTIVETIDFGTRIDLLLASFTFIFFRTITLESELTAVHFVPALAAILTRPFGASSNVILAQTSIETQWTLAID